MFFLSAANTAVPRFTVLVGMLLLDHATPPLPDSNQTNPVGPALASILAVARLFALKWLRWMGRISSMQLIGEVMQSPTLKFRRLI